MARKAEQSGEAISGMENAREYAKYQEKRANQRYRGIIKDIMAQRMPGSYLEVGAGPGFLAVMLAKQIPGIDITAVDISPDMAIVANEYITGNGLANRIRYLVGDARNAKFLQGLGKFNFVYSTHSLHHWKSAEDSLRNLWDAVDDNGVMYIYDYKRIGWLCPLPLKGGRIESMRAAYSTDEIKDILGNIGITEYRIETHFPFLFQSVIARKDQS